MRLVIIAAVDNRAEGSRFLDHIDGKALSEGTGRKLNLMHRLAVVDNPGVLIRQVNASRASETESLLIIDKVRNPHLHADGHQGNVAGIHDGIFQRFIPVAVDIVALNRGIRDEQRTVADKSVAVMDGTGLQCRSNRDWLENRTGLKAF